MAGAALRAAKRPREVEEVTFVEPLAKPPGRKAKTARKPERRRPLTAEVRREERRELCDRARLWMMIMTTSDVHLGG